MDRNRMNDWNQDDPAFDQDWGDESVPAPRLLGYVAMVGGVVLICGLIWLFLTISSLRGWLGAAALAFCFWFIYCGLFTR
jgi:hypothetical protein